VDRIKLRTPENASIAEMLDENKQRTMTLRLGTLKLRMDLASKLLAKKLPDFKPMEYRSDAGSSPEDMAAMIRLFVAKADVADGVIIEQKQLPPPEVVD
jgi:hypothetical protein